MDDVIYTIKGTDVIYTIKGSVYTYAGKADRYIQFRHNSRLQKDDPIIQSRMGYNRRDVVVFKTKEEAENFLDKFLSSDRRRTEYPIDWRIIEYKAQVEDDRIQKLYPIETSYGLAYKVRYSY